MREILRHPNGADDLLRTWVHESIHGRHRNRAHTNPEVPGLRGYEEGLAEGLARLIVREKAHMRPYETSYDYYVVAYRTLASAVGIHSEMLWRELWLLSPGQVRSGFVRILGRLLRQGKSSALAALAPQARAKLLGMADQQFRTDNASGQPNEQTLLRLWRTAFA